MTLNRSIPVAVLLFALCAPALCASTELSFELPQPARGNANLFELPEAPPTPIERGGGQSWSDGWPWGGIEISAWGGLYPVFLAASQTVDVGIPFTPWTSWVTRFELTAGLLFTGVIIDWGVRMHVDFNESVGVYAEAMGRYGIGELTIVELFESAFKEVVDAGVDSVGGFGFSLAGGIEVGGGHFRFIAGIEYGALFVDTNAYVDDFSFDLPTITINYFGFQIGMRIYLG